MGPANPDAEDKDKRERPPSSSHEVCVYRARSRSHLRSLVFSLLHPPIAASFGCDANVKHGDFGNKVEDMLRRVIQGGEIFNIYTKYISDYIHKEAKSNIFSHIQAGDAILLPTFFTLMQACSSLSHLNLEVGMKVFTFKWRKFGGDEVWGQRTLGIGGDKSKAIRCGERQVRPRYGPSDCGRDTGHPITGPSHPTVDVNRIRPSDAMNP
ncbi:hypothetical protein QJS10_CPA07g00638 [Acorus calamus]|uniref:Uncharacterized protein n=1 Tax=Acorus calamus TaxID=4465 RepID=A0AAV9EDZ5_ACOCL|nr:hypothetical protein QJS10_CPA07g00638 [Acorus calamus]